METENLIEDVKKWAKDVYDGYNIKLGVHDPTYVRKWVLLTDRKYPAYYLDGTPPKIFIICSDDKIMAMIPSMGITRLFPTK